LQALARAVYARKDTLIMDDVFSGLDAHTEDAIFHNLLGEQGILRRFKTTVIVVSSRCKRPTHPMQCTTSSLTVLDCLG
jgi:ATP-binding cassette subfamily C (CFTR/MRP) protein 1